MENDGQLEFGTWTGQENLATSPAAYNDGQWHYMVATQGPDGMKLYVDNQLVATNAQTGSQSYSGYWRIGGDTDWGGDSYYFAGSIDEAAVYSTVLTPAQIAAHYAASSAVAAPNQAPTAAFTSTAANLAATFDGSTSSDPDGTVASYAWNFGDGSTGTGANPAHTYAAAGTYTVSLTVTDNQGLASTAVTHPITVAAANQLPTAAFTFTTSGLGVTVNGTSSNDPDGTIASYAWDFGDSTTATGATPPAHVYASGATYPVKLTVTDNQGGTATVTQNVTVTAPVNQLPTAAFTSTTNGLAVTVDGSTSADSDGTIASYAWNYGDSKTDTGATPVPHTYAASGTYTVSLTVTDNSGGTNTITHPVTVTAPANQSPTAAFVTSVSNLSLAVNGSSSNDPDGTIANYAWDYGDGSSATGVTPTTHTYAAAGTYTVSLVVTDNQGATGSLSKTVTVSAPVTSAYATDTFTRTTASGFGTADLGGAWTVTGGASNFSVNGTTGRVNIATAGAGPTALLSSLAQANINAVIDTSFSSAATGGGTYVTLMARHTSTGDYRLKEHLVAGGAVQLLLTKVVGTTETTLKTVTIAGVTYTPGDVYKLRFIVNGDGTTTTLSGSLWKSGTTEPTTAQITATDTTASLQGAGSFGFQSYLSGSSTTAPVVVSYDNLSITPVGATPANLPPSAAFTTAVSNLAVTVNGSTSSDSDGSVASYAWNFGDGATATGATPTAHTYGAAGTYTISLTVTDNQGATNTVTHQVTVAGGTPVNQAPVAAFTSSVANLVATFDGSGSTDDGTIASYAWDFGDGASSTSMNPTHTYAGAGTFTVKLTVTDNGGLTNSVSHQVTTTAPGVTTLAADSFTRTAATGWGAADLGGSWTVSSASLFSVANGAGSVALKAAAAGPSAYLNSLSQANVNIVLDTSASAINSSVYTTLMARHSATSDYRLKQVRLATGAVQLSLSRVVNSVETIIKTVTVPGVTYTPGDVYRMRFVVNGNGTTTTLSGSLWKLGSTEPASPQITSSDTTASLQGAGTFGIQSYIASTATVFPVTETYDNLSITAP
jgi:PKD repeat protein